MSVHTDYSFPVIYVVMTSSIVPCCKHLRDVLVITVVWRVIHKFVSITMWISRLRFSLQDWEHSHMHESLTLFCVCLCTLWF